MPEPTPQVMEMAKKLFFNQCNIMHDHEKEWRKSHQELWLEQARDAIAHVLDALRKPRPGRPFWPDEILLNELNAIERDWLGEEGDG